MAVLTANAKRKCQIWHYTSFLCFTSYV